MDTDVGLMKRCFPHGYWGEFISQLHLAWPLSLSLLFIYLVQPISIAFCGHLGETELAAVAMAISMIYIVVLSVGRGLGFGGDSFFAQTYGSANKKNVGVYLQKGIIFAILWSMPVIGILLNTETIMLLIRQDAEVSRLAQDYLTLFCPGVVAYCLMFMLKRYLLCQNKVLPVVMIFFVCCCANGGLNYLLVYQAGMGIRGSAIAVALTYYMMLILMLIYIGTMRVYEETWAGWSFACLEEWDEFSRVTSYSICMNIIFWLCTEVGTFLGGMVSPKDLSAFAITFQVEGTVWIIALGIGGACTVRLGQFLGANQPSKAMNCARVALLTLVVCYIVLAVLCFGLKSFVPLIFTTDRALIDHTALVLQPTALFIFLEGIWALGVSLFRATANQAVGTVIILVAFYLIAWPIGISLMFATELGLLGLWLGLDVGMLLEDIAVVIYFMKINWSQEAEKAVKRSKVGIEINLKSSAEMDIEHIEAFIHKGEKFTPTAKNLSDPNDEYSELTRNLKDKYMQNTIGCDALKTLDTINAHANKNTTSYRKKIIISRLLVVLFFVLTLVFGIITRVYIHIRPYDATLCNSTSISDVTYNDNITITGYYNQTLGNVTIC